MHGSELIVGPQHPALKEPASFRVHVDGEKILSLDLDISYNHRGIEKGMEQRTFEKNIYLVERICGICSHSHTTNFCKGIEEIMNLTIPRRAQYIRVIMAELERIHSHLLWLGVEGHGMGFDTLFMYTWRDRETVLDLMETISGGRISHAMNRLGGVRRDVDDATAKKVLQELKFLEGRADYYINLVKTEKTLAKRMKGVGILSKKMALELAAVGPTARGSGVKRDIRKDDPYAAYGEIPFKMITSDSCDVYGRNYVRVYELKESLDMVRYALENLPKGDLYAPIPDTVKAAEVVSRYEAPRGELFYYIRTNANNMIERAHVRTPTFANWLSVVEAMKGMHIADIPIIIAAIDPCMSCTSRTTIVDANDRKLGALSWEELEAYSIKWYKGRGIGWEK
ncbi:MAG: nickel-dependent hydrogenase large subunit [Candidatus Diapherotrites archaeon]|nr:nickel-dependent hydrogenase large subunit [Candidatus Diapherotrites archaeon]